MLFMNCHHFLDIGEHVSVIVLVQLTSVKLGAMEPSALSRSSSPERLVDLHVSVRCSF
jgi:hypothetical protein